jgi:hypothetical protein
LSVNIVNYADNKNNMTPNFYTIGSFGDTIYSLCMVKYLGGGNMYVKLDAMDEFAQKQLGWANAGPASGRYTQRDYDLIEPLLNAQDYLDTVAVWKDEKFDYDFVDHWKYHMIDGHKGNQTECYALAQGLDIHSPDVKKKMLFEPWLTPVAPIVIPGKPYVVNRTARYLYGAPSEEWFTWVANGLGNMGVFVGNDEEHAEFETTFNCKIEHYKTKDLLELAQVIQGCEQFMGNQSVALSIAIGLGKSYWCEVRKDYEQTRTPHGGYGDTWFPRINGNYF